MYSNDKLLSELLNDVKKLYPELELQKLQKSFSNTLLKYNIEEINLSISNDLQEKVHLFLSTMKLEGLSKNTIKNYKLELATFSKHVHKDIDKINTNDIRLYLSKFNTLKPSTMATKLYCLKSFFGWLNNEEIIPKNPTKTIKTPKQEKRLPKALSIDELELMRECCETLRESALVNVLYATGCRLEETVNINIKDINWQDGSFRVIGKGDKERTVYLNFKAMYHLKKYLKSRNDTNPALFVQSKKPYGRLGGRSIQREIKKIAERTGLDKHIHPHALRHTLATLALNNGASISFVQNLLGHESPSTTQNYVSLTDEVIKQEYRKSVIQ